MGDKERRVLVAANYLPYTTTYLDIAKSAVDNNNAYLTTKPFHVRPTFACHLESPLIDGGDIANRPRNDNRRRSLDRMTATLLGIQADDSSPTGHPHDFSTPIPSPTIRPLKNAFVPDGMPAISSSVSSVDSFLIAEPYTDSGQDTWEIRPYFGGNSGLTNAISALKNRLWIGTLAGDLPSDLSEKERVLDKLNADYRCHVIDGNFDDHVRFCKRTMWPIFHNLLPDQQLALQATSSQGDWRAYVRTNQCFADKIIQIYEPDDVIWINDYHLLLVPQMVRTALPNATIGVFLHVPFPTSEIFRCLPVRQEILEGILASDLVGFQTYGYARHFFQCCTRILGYACTPRGVQVEGRIVPIGIFPIGIDPGRIEKRLALREITEMTNHIMEKYQGKKIIIARDKVDPVKGIRQKILGFMQFLRDNAEWRGRAILYQMAVAGHGKYLQSVMDLADEVNTRFGNLDYCPVVISTQEVSFEQYLALLGSADVCLITSLRDGMNLTSHEYVLCQQGKFGTVIISEFAGTSSTFGAALRDVADAILVALEMDEQEKRERHGSLLRNVRSNTANTWAASFLASLITQSDIERQRQSLVAPLINQISFCRDYQSVNSIEDGKRLFIIDYDALMPGFKNIPASLELLKELKSCLSLLSSDENIVALISERSAEQMDHTFSGFDHLVLCAEDGYCIRLSKDAEWKCCVNDPDPHWWERVQTILEYYTERTPGSWFERKSAAYIWHYENADPVFGERQAKECQAHIQDTIGSNFPVHAVSCQKRLRIRLLSLGQRQAIGNVLKSVLKGDHKVGFLSIFVKSRDEEELYTFCHEMIGRCLGLLPGASPSALSPNSSSPNVRRLCSYEADCPIYVCAIGDTNTADADQRIANAATLFNLLKYTAQ
ncbi:Tsl1p [Paramicrosporidium saccamoebae]|uniref:Tsl1p n=1 Tax=Paramicrosporidium saccamoebae TaxID=1246581 RepID=A0A2H9TQ01_9FUNG|nr:Tsl1p [Paramicrosporidium saccamoebae]